VSRNRSRQLLKVLAAIRRGSIQPREVLLADDASTDDTIEVFTRLCADLGLIGRVLAHPPGDRQFRINTMRNDGLRAARTQRVVILDADHVPGPNHLAAHMDMLDGGERVISIGPRMEYANEDGTGPVGFMWGHEGRYTVQQRADAALPHWQLVPASNMGLHRSFARRVGWFDDGYDGAYGYDDVDFTYRAHKQGAFFAGRFDAYVIHIPHETIFGTRENRTNALRFRRKHGFHFAYPPAAQALMHKQNWARRCRQEQSPPQAALYVPVSPSAPEAGPEGIEATRRAAANVGGRFLLRLAGEKLLARLRGRKGRP
jgi:glycosyltransferase involved in cell wall biosynthesis